jgi:hypothetical protein
MEAISSLPIPDDMEADYSPQYVKLARILRDKIISGILRHSTPCLPPPWLPSTACRCGLPAPHLNCSRPTAT